MSLRPQCCLQPQLSVLGLLQLTIQVLQQQLLLLISNRLWLERTKIKNREAAAKAHEKKQFLQGHKRIDVHPQPLKSTISGAK
ncbi:unnamed protein product [Coffea canephora]|uniref:DH200=94 genomic scaffold, scaffold_171 n=1 Tax=Coffea canephora TaxID=49390 RepID=A0A068VAN6_COFCA|nr:unnamed protein product [Coffea canephora]